MNVKKHDQNKITNYFEYGIDVENRRVFLMDEMTVESISHVCKALFFMDNVKEDVISLIIDSDGGDTCQMFKLLDTMNMITSDIETVAVGRCMSAAPIILANGAKGMRYAAPNTLFMVHQTAFFELHGKLTQVHEEVKIEERLSKRWDLIMEQLTGKQAKDWRKLCELNKDHYFDAKTALAYGLIDEIWE